MPGPVIVGARWTIDSFSPHCLSFLCFCLLPFVLNDCSPATRFARYSFFFCTISFMLAAQYLSNHHLGVISVGRKEHHAWRGTTTAIHYSHTLLARNTDTVSHALGAAPSFVVRPHRGHLLFERLERKLERRARVPDVELLEHARVQDPQLPDLAVRVVDQRPELPQRARRRRPVLPRRAVDDRRRAAGEEGRVWGGVRWERERARAVEKHGAEHSPGLSLR